MKLQQRHDAIVSIVGEKGRVTVEELAELLAASRETIRRDLTRLSNQGMLLKFHGGATLPRPDVEGPFQARMAVNARLKRQVAIAAASIFEPGDTLFIDTGTTTLSFAEELAKRNGLTVITNSSAIARTISLGETENRVFLIGGEFHGDNQETVGTLAIDQIRVFRTRHAVLTIGGLDAKAGAMDFNIEEAQVARAMIEQAELVTVLADSSKFDCNALFEVCKLDKINTLVCDQAPTGSLLESLKKMQVNIITTE
jgi:DeoR/GlpR family transcriptional regulator of sugar metabolism